MVVVIDCLLSILKNHMVKRNYSKDLRLHNTYLRKISLSSIMLPLLGFEVTLSLEEIGFRFIMVRNKVTFQRS